MNTIEPIIGPRASWRYLRLALSALLRPALAQLPPLPAAMRGDLLLCLGLYGYVSISFLLRIPGVSSGHFGIELVDQPLLHALWGITCLVVCLSQLAALVVSGWPIRRFSAIITAMWAVAFWGVTLEIAVQ